jgi:uncharacterized integral membrane protein
MKILALLIATMIAVGITIFSNRNPAVVPIDLLIGKVSVALSLALLGAGFVGALTGGVLVALLKQRAPGKGDDAKRKA